MGATQHQLNCSRHMHEKNTHACTRSRCVRTKHMHTSAKCLHLYCTRAHICTRQGRVHSHCARAHICACQGHTYLPCANACIVHAGCGHPSRLGPLHFAQLPCSSAS